MKLLKTWPGKVIIEYADDLIVYSSSKSINQITLDVQQLINVVSRHYTRNGNQELTQQNTKVRGQRDVLRLC